MSICKWFLGLIIIIGSQTSMFSMQQGDLDERLQRFTGKIDNLIGVVNELISRSMDAGGYSNHCIKESHKALELAQKTKEDLDRVLGMSAELKRQLEEHGRHIAEDFERKAAFAIEAIKAAVRAERGGSPEERLRIAREVGRAQGEAIGQANLDARIIDWKNFREMLGDTKLIVRIVAAIVIIALCIYIIKYGLPVLINYMTKPRVISEFSSNGWLRWFKPQSNISINELIFAPALHDQLQDLLVRVETAKKYNETLPNVLLYGDSGTGKTAFVRALAHASGLEYALTSGSEFAKITDLGQANEELRKLLTWAKKSNKGLIIFIDEAESLFANRKLPTTAKNTQDFINTFLSLVQDQSQKNLMFILATNHPFKLDDAVTNRIGKSIEFTLPEAPEREKILLMYLIKFAQENKEAIVNFPPEIKQLLPKYAEALKGLSPRAIKFVAEEMIIHARRQKFMQLTDEIAQAVIEKSKRSLIQTKHWEEERDKWVGAMVGAQA